MVQQNNPFGEMSSMLPLLMMGGGMNGGGGSKGDQMGGPQMEMLLRLMAPQLFQEDTVEAVASDLVGFGTAKDRSGDSTIGILEFMVIPPHKNDPVTRLRIKTNGPILAKPSDLKRLASEINRMIESGELAEAYELAREDEEAVEAEAQQANLMKGLAGGGRR